MQLFLVKRPDAHGVVIVNAVSREGAKRQAASWLFNDPDQYIVTPLTENGETFRVNVVVGG